MKPGDLLWCDGEQSFRSTPYFEQYPRIYFVDAYIILLHKIPTKSNQPKTQWMFLTPLGVAYAIEGYLKNRGRDV